MKFAAKVMYIIGRIENILLFILGIVLFILGIISAVGGAVGAIAEAEQEAEAYLAALGSGAGLITVGIVLFVINLVVLILSKKGIKALNNNTTENAPHIVMIVIGAISQNIFYILGGIFALVAEHSN